MAEATITLDRFGTSGNIHRDVRCEVFTRETWSDAWTLQPDIDCLRIIEFGGSQPAQCELVHDFGRVARSTRGDFTFRNTQSLRARGQFVRVDVIGNDVNDQFREVRFVGVISRVREMRHLKRSYLTAFDMRRVMQFTKLIDARGVLTTDTLGTIGWCPDFNGNEGAGGDRQSLVFGNRSADEFTVGGILTYVFDLDAAEEWTGHDTLVYLTARLNELTDMTWHIGGPTTALDELVIRLPHENEDTLSLANRLITGAGLGWRVRPVIIDSDPDNADGIDVEIRTYALHRDDVTLPSGAVLAGNPDTFVLPDAAPWIESVIFEDSDDRKYDEIVVRGDRLHVTTSLVNSLSGFGESGLVAELSQGWQTDDETAYKAESNFDRQASAAYEAVYCRYVAGGTYNPASSLGVKGFDRNGAQDAAKSAFLRGQRPTTRPNLFAQYQYSDFTNGQTTNVLPSAGHPGPCLLLLRKAASSAVIKVASAQPLMDAIGVMLPGGPKLYERELRNATSRVGITFGLYLDYRVEGWWQANNTDRGYRRTLVIPAPHARYAVARKAIWSPKKDSNLTYVVDGTIADDVARLRSVAAMKGARDVSDFEAAEVRLSVIAFDAEIGHMIRQGNARADTPIAQIDYDFAKATTALRTGRSMNA